MKKILAVSLGDPAGIGPEITVKTLADKKLAKKAAFVVIGDAKVFDKALRRFCPPPRPEFVRLREKLPEKFDRNRNYFIDLRALEKVPVPGKESAEAGRASMEYVALATRLALDGRVDAVVTAPINKKAIQMAGYKFQGHTDFLQHLTGAASSSMMLAAPGLRVVLVTVHIALREVPDALKSEEVVRAITDAHNAGKMLGIKKPRIGVCGLNPHAGESGRFGDEEGWIIKPAIDLCAQRGVDCRGPLPPDTAFFAAYGGKYDLMVCMYHDQGLIPLKMIGFEKGVNVTLGLPIVRTSPDHGTAYDIAWKGKASPGSMAVAVEYALQIEPVRAGRKK